MVPYRAILLGDGHGNRAKLHVHVYHNCKSAVNLSAFSQLSQLSSMSVWQKGDRLHSELRNKSSWELKLLLCYSAVIVPDKSDEYCREIVN